MPLKIICYLFEPNPQSTPPFYDMDNPVDRRKLLAGMGFDVQQGIDGLATTIRDFKPYREPDGKSIEGISGWLLLKQVKEGEEGALDDLLKSDLGLSGFLQALATYNKSASNTLSLVVPLEVFFRDDFQRALYKTRAEQVKVDVESALQFITLATPPDNSHPIIKNEYEAINPNVGNARTDNPQNLFESTNSQNVNLFKEIWIALDESQRKLLKWFAEGNRGSPPQTPQHGMSALCDIGILKKGSFNDESPWVKSRLISDFGEYVYYNQTPLGNQRRKLIRKGGPVIQYGMTVVRRSKKVFSEWFNFVLFLSFLAVAVWRLYTALDANPHRLYVETRFAFVALAIYWTTNASVLFSYLETLLEFFSQKWQELKKSVSFLKSYHLPLALLLIVAAILFRPLWVLWPILWLIQLRWLRPNQPLKLRDLLLVSLGICLSVVIWIVLSDSMPLMTLSPLLSLAFVWFAIINHYMAISDKTEHPDTTITQLGRSTVVALLLFIAFLFSYIPVYFYLFSTFEVELVENQVIAQYSTWTSRGDTVDYAIVSRATTPLTVSVNLPDSLQFSQFSNSIAVTTEEIQIDNGTGAVVNPHACQWSLSSGNKQADLFLASGGAPRTCSFSVLMPLTSIYDKIPPQEIVTFSTLLSDAAVMPTQEHIQLDILPVEMRWFQLLSAVAPRIASNGLFSNMRIWLLDFGVFWITVICEVAFAYLLDKLFDQIGGSTRGA